jgi:ERF superfamily
MATAEKLVLKTPAQLLEMAVAQGANVDQLSKLMDLQLRWQAEEARLAWIQAMAEFKAECPEILKTRHVKQILKDGRQGPEYWHAELDKACEILIPQLSRFGFTHRWEAESTKDMVTVTCVIQHKLGHAERTTLTAPADVTGGKNAVQALGSAKYYLERYTFFAALGIAPKGQDTDGYIPALGADRTSQHVEAIGKASNQGELNRVWKEAHEEAYAIRDYNSVREFLEAKDRRKDQIIRGEA